MKEDVQKQFSQNAEAYVKSTIHAKGKDLTKLLEISGASKSDLAIDIATGGGHVANSLAPLVNKVICYDITPEILKVAKEFIHGNGHLNTEFKEGDAEQMSYPDQTFDVVTCRIAPHHFPNVEKFVSEVSRILKPGGRFLLIDNVVPEDEEEDKFYNEIEKRRDYSHFRALKKTEWIKMLEKSGLSILEWYLFPKTFQFEDWSKRMNMSLEEKKSLNDYMINANQKIKNKFKIVIEDQQVQSFTGESIILKAVKA